MSTTTSPVTQVALVAVNKAVSGNGKHQDERPQTNYQKISQSNNLRLCQFISDIMKHFLILFLLLYFFREPPPPSDMTAEIPGVQLSVAGILSDKQMIKPFRGCPCLFQNPYAVFQENPPVSRFIADPI